MTNLLINSFEQDFVLGVKVNQINLDQLIQYVQFVVCNREKVVISNVNVHAINLAFKTGWFKDFINRSQVVFCDGYGVKWAAKFLTGKSLHRMTPPDWFDELAVMCVKQGISLYFLGTRQDVIEKASNVLIEKHPGLQIAGTHHGFFDKNVTSSENIEVVETINLLKPNILVVGFGMPVQEKWIMENIEQLPVNVVIPVGAYFDYLAGEVVRAPRWMTDMGLEWLGRLLIEPQRLWKRYILGNPLFVWRVLLQKFKIRDYNSALN